MAISFNGSTYNQNFDTLAQTGTNITWSNDSTIPGWYLFRQPVPGTPITAYNADNGSSSTGSFYSYGSTSSSDRALGGLGSGGSYFGSPGVGAVAGWIAFAATNTTGSTINSVTVNFNGEQWRNGGNTTAQTMVMQYGFGTSFTSVPTWTPAGTTFNWTSPVATATPAAVDGNTTGRVNNVGGTLSSLNWANGDTLWFRWIENNDAGNDHGLAIDDFSISVPSLPTVNLSVSTNSQLESNTTAIVVTVTASAPVTGNQTVTLNVSNVAPGDYNLSNTTITILDGQTTGSVNFAIVNDSLLEGNEIATLSISNPSAGITLGTTTSQDITIIDNDVIQITEYMYQGANGEFVELTNVGTQPIDLTGWSFDDNSRTSGSFSLSAFGVVNPGESVIVTETVAAVFRTAWNLPATVKIIGGLNQNLGRNDEINIYDNTGALVDRLTYDDQTYSGTVRTQNKSAWTPSTNLDPFTINTSWVLSAVGDAQNSYTSTGGDIGNPGNYVASPPSVNAPTIVVNTTNTTNFLDGGAQNLLPTSGAGAVSGVINDPTDPAKTLGIDFTLADPDTPVANLTVTATSSNASVVPNGNLTLTGTGAARNLKINPVGVGFADITVTVSDGTNTATYTINYAASAASNTPTTTRFLTGASDASTAIAIDADYMFVADDEDQTIRLYDRNDSGLPLNSFDFTSVLGLSGTSEVDIEASTKLGSTIYWMGSHSNNSSGNDRPNRKRIFSTTISGTGASATLTFGGYYKFLEDDLIAWDNSNGHGLGAGFLGLAASAASGVSPEQTNGFNIEGFTVAPDGTTGYIAFRAPNLPTTSRTKALIIPVTNFTSILDSSGGTAGSATFGAPIQLDLGGRGIRSIERNGTGEYVIITGPAGAATGTPPQ